MMAATLTPDSLLSTILLSTTSAVKATLYPSCPAAMIVFMLSLTGMPLTLGRVGKFILFRTAMTGGFLDMAPIGALTSLVSAYYIQRSHRCDFINSFLLSTGNTICLFSNSARTLIITRFLLTPGWIYISQKGIWSESQRTVDWHPLACKT